MGVGTAEMCLRAEGDAEVIGVNEAGTNSPGHDGVGDAPGSPLFLDASELTEEQRTDPHYRLKVLASLSGQDIDVLSCSKCHHCR